MERSDRALRHVRLAYERARVLDGIRGVAIAAGVVVLAIGLHRITSASWMIAAALAASLGTLGWRGGAWRRGAFAGVIAGLPPLIVPSIALALTTKGHCVDCGTMALWPCLLACFGTSALVGSVVGARAISAIAPRGFAIGAISTAALTGLLGCGTTGLGGALGVVLGLGLGGLTGWIVAGRTATA